MGLQYKRGVIAGAWVLTAGLIGALGNVTSMGAGALIFGFGLIPPLLLILRASAPPLRHRRGTPG